ncbi:MAG: response regulator [Helicobacter sp.]|nr:response regulator [Helicobacter sp.]MBD5168406.1 response regulator [Helicobacter sp.]MDE5815973.1 response regulator [Helicobacter sp.]MDE6044250.1 response regulator [Helicobacter sp.]MDE7196735.1 response regulator [Helicobacter sp.]
MPQISVLVADSSPITKKLILSALKKLSVPRILECPDGDTVLEYLDENMDFNVLFLNSNVTGMDYHTLITKMKGRGVTDKITIFLVSNQLNDAQYRLLQNDGVKHFITKPFNAIKLESIITPIIRTLMDPQSHRGIFENEYKDEILEILQKGVRFQVVEQQNLILTKSADRVLKIPLDAFLRIVRLERIIKQGQE